MIFIVHPDRSVTSMLESINVGETSADLIVISPFSGVQNCSLQFTLPNGRECPPQFLEFKNSGEFMGEGYKGMLYRMKIPRIMTSMPGIVRLCFVFTDALAKEFVSDTVTFSVGGVASLPFPDTEEQGADFGAHLKAQDAVLTKLAEQFENAVASAETVEPGEQASVVISKECDKDGNERVKFEFSIPQGVPGAPGQPGGIDGVDLPQKWYDLNERLEDDHRIMGGLIYVDMNGNIKVTPLVPPYGIREDECGEGGNALVMYNGAQQILCKAPTDPRHTVNLGYFEIFFGTEGKRNFVVSEKDNPNTVESGTNNAVTGKNTTIKSGNCNRSSASRASIKGDCNAVSGWDLDVHGDGISVSGNGHRIGDAEKGYKVNYADVSGQGHKVGKEKTVKYIDVSGFGNNVSHDGVDASGGNHTSSRDYQVLRGFGSTPDADAALILALGKNIFTVGADGTRKDVGTDAVTVDFLKKYVEDRLSHIPRAEGGEF